MTIRLALPQAIYEVGGRSQNEDHIFPPPGSATAKGMWYIVCDGVGGANKGELASQLLSEGLNQYFTDYPPIGPITEEYLQAALTATEQQMESYVTDHPEAHGMATTLTLLFLDEKGATIGWIGDSRVYQFREGQCVYQTQDHSLVNQLVQQGVLTEEEAEHHPRRNIILRAVKGSSEPADLEVYQTSDIQPGDIFLLCTDGLLEQWNTQSLAELSGSGLSLANIRSTLHSKSQGQTSDNFSAYLLQVDKVNGQKKARTPLSTPPDTGSQNRGWLGRVVWAAVIVGLLVIAGLFLWEGQGEVRKQAFAAHQAGNFVEAVYWMDSLADHHQDDARKLPLVQSLQDSMQQSLFLWMSDSTTDQYQVTFYGCGLSAEALQAWGSKRPKGTIYRLRQACQTLSTGLDSVSLRTEGDAWWRKDRMVPALKLYEMARKLDSSAQAQLRMQLVLEVMAGDRAFQRNNPGEALGHYRQAGNYAQVLSMPTTPLADRFQWLGEASPFPAPLAIDSLNQADSLAVDSISPLAADSLAPAPTD